MSAHRRIEAPAVEQQVLTDDVTGTRCAEKRAGLAELEWIADTAKKMGATNGSRLTTMNRGWASVPSHQVEKPIVRALNHTAARPAATPIHDTQNTVVKNGVSVPAEGVPTPSPASVPVAEVGAGSTGGGSSDIIRGGG